MKLNIVTKIEPIDIMGRFDPMDLTPPVRELYINEERVPPTLEKIILIGIDVLGEQYLKSIEEQMKKDGIFLL